MTEFALREDRDGIASVTLNRPDKRNAISIAMREVIFEAVDDLREKDDLRVLLIRANGDYFSAGIDIVEYFKVRNPNRTMEMFRREYRRKLHMFLDEMEAVEKPVVMAIQGPCLGLALEMAGAVDFRLASENAQFGLPEIDLGMIAGSGGTSRMARLCGVGWAKWLAMAGEKIDARTAFSAGLVQAVWPQQVFEHEVWSFCQRLVDKPGDVLGVAKLAVDLCYDLDRRGGRDIERIANTPFALRDNSARAEKLRKKKDKSISSDS
jgi:enoyl-CoA hydratase/carnithine racemase